MNLEKLNSEEFKKDFSDTINQINEKYRLSIKCGQICYDQELLTIYIEDDTLSE